MSKPESELDQHLRGLFSGLDTRADFDARLMARLRAESQVDATQWALRARQRERARYRGAVLRLQSWRRSTLLLLTLDALGISLVTAAVVIAAWPRFGPDVVGILRDYGPVISMLLAALMAAVPLLAIFVEQSRRPARLL